MAWLLFYQQIPRQSPFELDTPADSRGRFVYCDCECENTDVYIHMQCRTKANIDQAEEAIKQHLTPSRKREFQWENTFPNFQNEGWTLECTFAVHIAFFEINESVRKSENCPNFHTRPSSSPLKMVYLKAV